MRKFLINSLLATLFVFAFMWGISKITTLNLFNAFDPIAQALSDFELIDYAFSNIRPDPLVDERIVLVNIGNLTRGELAQQISIIAQHKPKVIGIDGFFNCEGGLRDTVDCPQLLDTLGNLLLSNAIKEAGNVVLVSKLLQSDSLSKSGAIDVYDSIEYSDPMFQDVADYGYASLPTGASYQEDVKICRTFFPKIDVNGKMEYAFAVKLAMKYDPLKAAKLLSRENDEEVVNFRGNIDIQDVRIKALRGKDLATTKYPVMFYALDVHQPFNGEFLPEMIHDKIVIFGFLGKYFGDPSWNDKFFTPLNKKVSGRANPDMFGLVVHANILATILNEDYIDELPEWITYLIAFIFCYLNVALFYVINHRYPMWFDSVSLVIQVLQIVLLMGFTIWLFAASNFKLDLTLTLATIAAVGPCFEFYFNVLRPGVARLWVNVVKRLPKANQEY
ncbi:CHASE2 domain-containing protein [Ohtaekwangia sp.]|uniref:CHASE2 domain-containing protein n=1 Tax=Ohtaekwangia sp. TaxID=2066019 RepID=UPI002F9592C8